MVIMQNSTRPAGRSIAAGPACPSCGRAMHLARIAPRQQERAELRVYRCGECGVSLSEAADEDRAPARMSA